MKTHIAFLRGINVSGQKKILMSDLRQMLESVGLREVQTYIQSGNVVFQSALNPSECEQIIFQEIKDTYGWEVPVLVRTFEALSNILNNCPFEEGKREKSYYIILHSQPEKMDMLETQELSIPDEEFLITDECIYIHYAVGAGKAKFGTNWFEKKLNVKATARNYNTMVKLIALFKQ
ncbi:MAG: DUF1697 domain-containing protein [Flavobacteriaceae bacterium]|nr:DUF1697 domain-containing protein [Bacteroidia bacterium]NNL61770.1 DUF1697 domain-containing protein [Flavobacteriaceae bacterium]